jgi:phosphatidylglycerol:prolipoprotein diacylglycerol transferase
VLPIHVDLWGRRLVVWDLTLLVGVLLGYLVLHAAFAAPRRGLWLRYLVTVYVAVLAAQLFSYAFDAGTTVLPPPGFGAAAYYLSPLAGPKTLYGAVVALPLAVYLVSSLPRDLAFGRALACWTPAMFSVLAAARVGCFLQGCCYGVHSDTLGMSFAPGSVVHGAQFADGLVALDARSLPVVPTQAIEGVVLACIAVWSFRRARGGGPHVFPHSVAVYSVFRFAIEALRDDPARNQLGLLSTSQWVALAVLAVYCACLAALRAPRPRQIERAALEPLR